MADLPLVDFLPLIIAIVTIVIAVFAIYKYIQMEKKQSDLVIGIAFLLLTLAIIVPILNLEDFGGLELWLTLVAYLVFLITIEPMRVVRHFQESR
ncbi:MAG: hypothetical protein ACW963_10320 [Candidatus Sifarchaeia archaeon]|jgi:CDP-diglyceride synthetase